MAEPWRRQPRQPKFRSDVSGEGFRCVPGCPSLLISLNQNQIKMNIHQLSRTARRLTVKIDALVRRYNWNKIHNPLGKTPGDLLHKLQIAQAASRHIDCEVGARNIGGTPHRCALPKKQQRRLGLLPPVEVVIEPFRNRAQRDERTRLTLEANRLLAA